MTLQEIEERYNKSVTAIKTLEQIIKSQDTNYDTHITRLGWLKHLADSITDLKRLETEFLKISQAAAAQAAQRQALAQQAPQVVQQPISAPAPQPPVKASPAPSQEVETEEEAPKKPKKRL